MPDSEDGKPKKYVQAPPLMMARASPGPGAENQIAAAGLVVSSILRWWRREDMLRKGRFALQGLAFLFSLLAFIIMASNEHGGWRDFHKYEEYRITGKYINRLLTLVGVFHSIVAKVMAYFLISAVSAAIPLTDGMRDGADNALTDSSAAAITMAFLAFLSLALSAVISGYRLST
ncbi:CASP-like protein 4B4 [Eucalyptus grandis]|uniref:CASP-like protein 4B4 n=1 Tax=Eucalyptus grandis TaxID=71139 RepID=UPI00192E8D4F|nr:CASP-like protein 4B4 [Eucalyptus grandis]